MANAYDFRKDPKSPKMQSKESPAKSSSSSAGKETSGKLRSIRIECAENGYTVRCEHEQPKSTRGDMSMPYVEPKEYVFEDAKSVLDYIGKKLKG